MVKFGDVAQNVVERADPSHTDADVYVGLEHLDSDALHLHRWGRPSDVIGEKLVFKMGDIIFGKRRAYQRKLAIAEFDGICSAHAMVLRPKPERVWPEFLPFFLQSDVFMDRAIEISVGSLSPTINWGTLRDQEFTLPPIEEQQHIADALWACDRVLQTAESACNRSKQALLAAADSLCWSRCPDSGEIRQIADSAVGSFLDGDWIESKDQASGGVRLVQLADIGDGTFLDKSDRHISEATFDRLKCTEVFPGDILVSRMADPIGRACIVPQMGERMITAVDCTIVRVDKSRHSTQYWQYFMLSKRWKQLVRSRAGGSTRLRISRKNLETIQVPLPPLAVQKSMVADLDTIANVIKTASSYRDRSQSLAVCLRDQLLSSAISGELDV